MAETSKDNSVEKNAQKDAKHIHDVLDKDGTKAAYEAMLTDIDSARKSNSANLPQYKEHLGKALEKEKILPDLSIEWGRRAANKVDVANGMVDATKLSPYADGKLKVDALTHTMASSLRTEIGSNTVSEAQLGYAVSQRDQVRQNQKNETKLTEDSKTDGQNLQQKRTEYGGRSLLELADAAGGAVDGKVAKNDIDKLIDNKILPMSEKDQKFLKDLSDNWDSDKVSKLRGGGEYITAESLKKNAETTAAPTPEAKPTPDQTLENSKKDAAAAASVRDKLTQSDATKYNGRSLLDLADAAGGVIDGKIGKNDLTKLVNNKLVNLSKEDSDYVNGLIKNWDTPQAQKLMSSEGYLTKDSLDKAAVVPQEAAADNATQTRKRQAEISDTLQSSKIGNNSLFKAADIAGENEDGLVGKEDLQKLLVTPLVTLSEQQSTFVKKLIEDWDTPEVQGLRKNSSYISESTLANASLT